MFPQPEQVAQYVLPLRTRSPGQSVVAVGVGRSSGMINCGLRCPALPNSLRWHEVPVQGQIRSGLVSRHEVSGRGRGGRLVRVLRACIRVAAAAVWLPAVVVLVWCAMAAGPDVLAVAQTSAWAQEPSDLGSRAGRAAAAVEDEGEGQGVGGSTLDG